MYIKAKISPLETLDLLQLEIKALINGELKSLYLPDEELHIPTRGFDSFQITSEGQLIALEKISNDSHRTTVISWGVERFKKMLNVSRQLAEIRYSNTFNS